jgi:hypothetical protein
MSYKCETGSSDAGHLLTGDTEDGVSLDVPSFSSLLCTSMDLSLVQMASEPVSTTSGDKSSEGEVSPFTESAEWLPSGTDRLWDLGVRTFVYVERLFHCCYSFYSCTGLCSPGGLHLKRGIM